MPLLLIPSWPLAIDPFLGNCKETDAQSDSDDVCLHSSDLEGISTPEPGSPRGVSSPMWCGMAQAPQIEASSIDHTSYQCNLQFKLGGMFCHAYLADLVYWIGSVMILRYRSQTTLCNCHLFDNISATTCFDYWHFDVQMRRMEAYGCIRMRGGCL